MRNFAYRGYLVTPGLEGEWFISKSGFHIMTAASPEQARTIIDELIG